MKTATTLAVAGLAGLLGVGSAQAMPVALPGAAPAPIVRVDTVVTKTVRHGPFGGRTVTKKVVHRGPMGKTVVKKRMVD